MTRHGKERRRPGVPRVDRDHEERERYCRLYAQARDAGYNARDLAGASMPQLRELVERARARR